MLFVRLLIYYLLLYSIIIIIIIISLYYYYLYVGFIGNIWGGYNISLVF